MLDYHERAEERLKEKARDLPRKSVARRPARARRGWRATRWPASRRTRSGSARWRTEMSAADRATYERVAGDLLAELGYEVGEPAEPEPEPAPVR